MEYMEYPHWIMVAGAALLAMGILGLTFGRGNRPQNSSDR
jgi:hypothetical protein